MSKDKFLIDDSKIAHHPDRVKQWVDARGNIEEQLKVYPIYLEVSPVGGCNHRCTFCSVEYLGYEAENVLDPEVLKERLGEMGKLGIKSIMYAGEGEPLMHKNLAEIITHAKSSGIDNAITTNATPLTEKFVYEALPSITWIKASINAGNAKDYAAIHRTREGHFDLVWKNMRRAVEIRNELGLDPEEHTLGTQLVLIPENVSGIVDFAKRAKDSGLDYAVIKPYSHHKSSQTRTYEGLRYDQKQFLHMEEELDKLGDDNFEVIFRRKTMDMLNVPHEDNYTVCPSTPFMWGYVMATGDVYGCSAYLLDERFRYGNLNEQSFQGIWEGEKRRKAINFVENELDISECRENCRMRQVNLFLVDAKNNPSDKLAGIYSGKPPGHVNFI